MRVAVSKPNEIESRSPILQVAVDRFRHADHLHAGAVGLDAGEQRFGEHCGIGVGIVTADDDDGVELVFDAGFADLCELLVALDLGAVRAEESRSRRC
jgi:hypothetical protein